MNDLSQPFSAQVTPLQVLQCQQEVRKCLETFMRINASTSMEMWSDELRDSCRQVTDGLAAIEIYLYLLHPHAAHGPHAAHEMNDSSPG
jgi:hypothetical protein